FNCLCHAAATTYIYTLSLHDALPICVTVSGDLLANNGSALVAAAVGGQGIIYQPQFIVAGALRRGELVVLELDKPAMDVGGIHLLYPPDRRPPAKVRVMADYLIESFKDEVPWALT